MQQAGWLAGEAYHTRRLCFILEGKMERDIVVLSDDDFVILSICQQK